MRNLYDQNASEKNLGLEKFLHKQRLKKRQYIKENLELGIVSVGESIGEEEECTTNKI